MEIKTNWPVYNGAAKIEYPTFLRYAKKLVWRRIRQPEHKGPGRPPQNRKNVQYVADRGGVPRIQVKENVKETTPAKWAPDWKRMVRDRRRRPKRWLNQYHQRSNSEAVNGSFKKRQGPYLFSKRWRNQVAELHLKVVVYNLRLLVKRRVRVALA